MKQMPEAQRASSIRRGSLAMWLRENQHYQYCAVRVSTEWDSDYDPVGLAHIELEALAKMEKNCRGSLRSRPPNFSCEDGT